MILKTLIVFFYDILKIAQILFDNLKYFTRVVLLICSDVTQIYDSSELLLLFLLFVCLSDRLYTKFAHFLLSYVPLNKINKKDTNYPFIYVNRTFSINGSIFLTKG